METVRIVGCGRWSMGDDRAGLLVARQLAAKRLPNTAVVESEDPFTDLTDEGLSQLGLLIIVDAAGASNEHPRGTCRRIDYRAGPRLKTAPPRIDTHQLSVSAALEVAEQLGHLPPCVWLYLVFGSRFRRDLAVSPAVEAGVCAVADQMERDVQRWMRDSLCTSSP